MKIFRFFLLVCSSWVSTEDFWNIIKTVNEVSHATEDKSGRSNKTLEYLGKKSFLIYLSLFYLLKILVVREKSFILWWLNWPFYSCSENILVKKISLEEKPCENIYAFTCSEYKRKNSADKKTIDKKNFDGLQNLIKGNN